MPHRKDQGNMRLNHDEENILGQGESQGAVQPQVEKAPTKHPAHDSGHAHGKKKGPDKACRHHIDESLGGAHHD